MTDNTLLLTLMSWLSPVFPTGGFAYSAGLEQAVADGFVTDADALQNWISCQIEKGSFWNDVVFLVEAHRSADDVSLLEELAALACALSSSRQRVDETLSLGTSFLQAAEHWLPVDGLPRTKTPLPICVGYAAKRKSIPVDRTVSAYLHALCTSQVQAAIRLSVCGQDGAARTLAQLEPIAALTADRAAVSTLDDLGSCAVMADIAAMNHETLQPRLFLS